MSDYFENTGENLNSLTLKSTRKDQMFKKNNNKKYITSL
jgi:hypothetical protein